MARRKDFRNVTFSGMKGVGRRILPLSAPVAATGFVIGSAEGRVMEQAGWPGLGWGILREDHHVGGPSSGAQKG